MTKMSQIEKDRLWEKKLNKEGWILPKVAKLRDLKVGDIVATAEIFTVVKINDSTSIEVVELLPACYACKVGECGHVYVKEIGYGQQGLFLVPRRR
jgi:hypothetical protein